MDAEATIRRLGLRPHPEGGYYRETFRSPWCSRCPTAAGATPRPPSTTCCPPAHGAPGTASRPTRSGTTTTAARSASTASACRRSGSIRAQPQAVVPAGVWQAAETEDERRAGRLHRGARASTSRTSSWGRRRAGGRLPGGRGAHPPARAVRRTHPRSSVRGDSVVPPPPRAQTDALPSRIASAGETGPGLGRMARSPVRPTAQPTARRRGRGGRGRAAPLPRAGRAIARCSASRWRKATRSLVGLRLARRRDVDTTPVAFALDPPVLGSERLAGGSGHDGQLRQRDARPDRAGAGTSARRLAPIARDPTTLVGRRSGCPGPAGSRACSVRRGSTTGGHQPSHGHRLRRARSGRRCRRRAAAWWRWWRISISPGARSTSTTAAGLVTGYFHLSRMDVARGRHGGGRPAHRRRGPERPGHRPASALDRAVRRGQRSTR